MSRLDDTRSRLEELNIQPDILETCLRVVDTIAKVPAEKAKFLPLSFFSEKFGGAANANALTRALNLLCSMEQGPLELHGYIVSDGEILPIPDEDFGVALRGGDLIHPISGELVANPLSRLHLYYSVDDNGLIE